MEAEQRHGGVGSRPSAMPCGGGGVKFSSPVAVGFGRRMWGFLCGLIWVLVLGIWVGFDVGC